MCDVILLRNTLLSFLRIVAVILCKTSGVYRWTHSSLPRLQQPLARCGQAVLHRLYQSTKTVKFRYCESLITYTYQQCSVPLQVLWV